MIRPGPLIPTEPRTIRPAPVRTLVLLIWAGVWITPPAFGQTATNASGAFDQANKLYEQARYEQAALAYQTLLESNPKTPTLLFNMGNAWYRAGVPGQAISAYRQAQRIAPRDPAIRFNLNFVRKQVTGRDEVPGSIWRKTTTQLTLNEWSTLGMAAFWGWFILLALREWRPQLRPALRGYTTAAALATFAFAAGLASVAHYRFGVQEAVVSVKEAVVRFGPLQEAQVNYQLVDGSEVTVLDRKEVASAGLPESWLQISDGAGRTGWLRESQVNLIE